MIPIALGNQTGGSVIRPASFNGVYGYAPTYGLVSLEGVRPFAPSLDTIGWFARSVSDLTMVARLFRLIGAELTPTHEVRRLKIGLCRTPLWEHAETASREVLIAAARRLEAAGATVSEVELPPAFDGLAEAQRVVMNGEGDASFLPEYLGAHVLLAADFRDKVENTAGVGPETRIASHTLANTCRPTFDALFGEGLDALLTPASPGEAPLGLHATGDSIFNGLWTLLHVPCIAIPAGRGPHDLPIGVQLVGPRFGDGRLLSMAQALAPVIDVDNPRPPSFAERTDRRPA